MVAQQLWLFPEPKPLRDRLGNEFFKQVPRCPGVYLMRDRQSRVLYVGQSANLRERLNTYKNLQPGKDPRRLVRLAQAVTDIQWEQCDSPECARLRENQLLRLHRPRFNKMNTRPEGYGFIGLRQTDGAWILWLSVEPTPGEELYGAFKGLRWQGYAALLRLLARVCAASACHNGEFPAGLLSARPPQRVHFPSGRGPRGVESGTVFELLQEYLEGKSREWVEKVRGWLPPEAGLQPFWGNLQVFDLETAQEFYERGPRRNYLLREQHAIQGRIIPPAALDDLLVLSRPSAPVVAEASPGFKHQADLADTEWGG